MNLCAKSKFALQYTETYYKNMHNMYKMKIDQYAIGTKLWNKNVIWNNVTNKNNSSSINIHLVY